MAGDSLGIGSVYSPPKNDEGPPSATRRKHVETVIDVGYRKEVGYHFLPSMLGQLMSIFQGWLLKCEKGGVRRILMNVFGNSLKFTTVSRRQICKAQDQMLTFVCYIGWVRTCHAETGARG